MKKRDERTPMKMSRRSFLKLAGATGLGLGGVLAGCTSPAESTTAAPTDGTDVLETTEGNILVENPEVAASPLPKEDKVVRTVCAPNCTGSCAINAYVKDDTIIKVEPGEFPDPSYNRICLKGISSAMQRVYSADRIKYPMKRVGARGEGKWERLSWDDAIALLADKFTTLSDQYGSTAISFIAMTGNYGVLPQMLTSRMAASVGGTAFTNFGI
ncbi:MAG: molybdopterin-dependent oxidoreductase, partial [Lachnospiraceae bacterium]|nr:molybdopterin-dependent oxidoreductase [Lachnospiraceae bacterium]